MAVEDELKAIHKYAVALLSDRAFLRITGSDATRWLNGMVTNSIQALKPGEGNYNFLLNAQGRIQGDCTIYRDPDSKEPEFLLETDNTQLKTIHQLLDKFIIMDDVELTPAYESAQSLLLIGPEGPVLLPKLGLPASEPISMAHISIDHGAVLLLTPYSFVALQFHLRGSADAVFALKAAALQSGVTEISSESLEAFRILSGTPRFGTDIRDRDLPQETNQSQALHFAKGCYLGQEIVERIRSRGQVHRLFTAFQLQGDMPALPTPLEANGKAVGEITSATRVAGQIYALGYARREAHETQAEITYSGGTAQTRKPGLDILTTEEPALASNPS